LEACLRFAREDLGEASWRALRRPAAGARVLARRRHGFRMRDATLAEVHRAARTERAVADEFVAYFLQDMLRVGSGALRAGLRRYLDTGDLVQSVLGDLWSDLAGVEFESRARFVALLGKRLAWKAGQHARRLDSARRREDLRADGNAAALDPAAESAGPATRAELDEETGRLVLVLHRLSARDRRLLHMRLAGADTAEVARREGLTPETARKATNRALERARALVRRPR